MKGRAVGLSAVVLVAFLSLSLLSMPVVAAHASPATASQTSSMAGAGLHTTPPSWAVRGDQYVHVVNYVAHIDPAIRVHLSADDVRSVEQAVARYNALPVSQKQPRSGSQPHATTSPADGVHPYIPPFCNDQWRDNRVWWGESLWLNHCAANDLAAGVALSAIFGIWVPPIAVLAIVYAADINWAMGQCSGNVFINEYGYTPPPVVLPDC